MVDEKKSLFTGGQKTGEEILQREELIEAQKSGKKLDEMLNKLGEGASLSTEQKKTLSDIKENLQKNLTAGLESEKETSKAFQSVMSGLELQDNAVQRIVQSDAEQSQKAAGLATLIKQNQEMMDNLKKGYEEIGMKSQLENSEEWEKLKDQNKRLNELLTINNSNLTDEQKKATLEQGWLRRNLTLGQAKISNAFEDFATTVREQPAGEATKQLAGDLNTDLQRFIGPLAAVGQNIPFLMPIAKWVGKMGAKVIFIAGRWIKQQTWDRAFKKKQALKEDQRYIADQRKQLALEDKRDAPQRVEGDVVEGDTNVGGGMLGLAMALRSAPVVLGALATSLPAIVPTLVAAGATAKFIILGAGALGLAFAAMGAGAGVGLGVLAAGILALGMAMPVMADGFMAFDSNNNPDAPDAASVAKNILLLAPAAGALFLLGLASGIAGLGGLLSSGMPQLAENFKAFDTDNLDGRRIGTNINNLGSAMDSLAAISTGSMAASFKGMLSSWFQGLSADKETPMARLAKDMKAFEQINGVKLAQSGEGIKSLGLGMFEWNKAMKEEGWFTDDEIPASMLKSLEDVAGLPPTLDFRARAIRNVAESLGAFENINFDNEGFRKMLTDMEKIPENVVFTDNTTMAVDGNLGVYQNITGKAIAAAAVAAMAPPNSGNTANTAIQTQNNYNTNNSRKSFVATGGQFFPEQFNTLN